MADRGRLVDAETRFALAADVPSILQGLIAAIADDRVHAEVHESAGMKQPSSIAGIGQNLCDPRGRHSFVILRTSIQSGPGRALNRKETTDRLRIGWGGIFKKEALTRQDAEMGHRSFAGAVRMEVLGAGRFQMDYQNVPPGGLTA